MRKFNSPDASITFYWLHNVTFAYTGLRAEENNVQIFLKSRRHFKPILKLCSNPFSFFALFTSHRTVLTLYRAPLWYTKTRVYIWLKVRKYIYRAAARSSSSISSIATKIFVRSQLSRLNFTGNYEYKGKQYTYT